MAVQPSGGSSSTRAAAAEGLTFAEGRALRLVRVHATQQQLTEVLAVDKSRVSTILEVHSPIVQRLDDDERQTYYRILRKLAGRD